MISIIKALFETVPQMTFEEFQNYIQKKSNKIKKIVKENENIVNISYGLTGERIYILDPENSKGILDDQELKNKYKGVWNK